ncbi:MAG: hypothetical protein HY268_12420 [Deltaproteobacteria bacterium]|nr:hypothetical protein [Deltaproteobacteria bacterium]
MATIRLGLHSTHESAEKIAGIGAVLDGILPEPDYLDFFGRSLLAGPYHFPEDGSILAPANASNWHTFFDSAGSVGVQSGGILAQTTRSQLGKIAERYGSRIVFGERRVGSRGTWVPVILASPSGIKRERVIEFRDKVKTSVFRFDYST